MIPFGHIRRSNAASQSCLDGDWTIVKMDVAQNERLALGGLGAASDNGVAAGLTAVAGACNGNTVLGHTQPAGCLSLFARKDGIYHVSGRLLFAGQATPAGRRQAMLCQSIGGGNVIPVAEHAIAMAQGGTVTAGVASTPYMVSLSATVVAVAGDEFWISAYQSSGGSLAIAQSSAAGSTASYSLSPFLNLTWLGALS